MPGPWTHRILFLSLIAASWFAQAATPVVPGWYADAYALWPPSAIEYKVSTTYYRRKAKLEFNSDGTIRPVTLTTAGVTPSPLVSAR